MLGIRRPHVMCSSGGRTPSCQGKTLHYCVGESSGRGIKRSACSTIDAMRIHGVRYMSILCVVRWLCRSCSRKIGNSPRACRSVPAASFAQNQDLPPQCGQINRYESRRWSQQTSSSAETEAHMSHAQMQAPAHTAPEIWNGMRRRARVAAATNFAGHTAAAKQPAENKSEWGTRRLANARARSGTCSMPTTAACSDAWMTSAGRSARARSMPSSMPFPDISGGIASLMICARGMRDNQRSRGEAATAAA